MKALWGAVTATSPAAYAGWGLWRPGFKRAAGGLRHRRSSARRSPVYSAGGLRKLGCNCKDLSRAPAKLLLGDDRVLNPAANGDLRLHGACRLMSRDVAVKLVRALLEQAFRMRE